MGNAGDMTRSAADKEKQQAALSSVVAAVLLTVMKLVVGISTNSLGILSEAAHSGLDLLAAGVTFGAVRYASLPPDADHHYGHGKVENLSALVEALLLLVTCGWIIWEAADRLFFSHTVVKPSLWALGVMVISILVDISRSRMLKRVAKKHRSQALEADALHFSTDILSSSVVIVGLLALYAAEMFPQGSMWRFWLEQADAVAALGVSFIVIKVSYTLGKQAVNVLLDAGDAAMAALIHTQLSGLPGLKVVRSVRLRHSGPDLFVDLGIEVDQALLVAETELLRLEVVQAVREVADHAEVAIAFTSHGEEHSDKFSGLRGLAVSCGLVPHAVDILDVDLPSNPNVLGLAEIHVEFPPYTPVGEAHERTRLFEAKAQKTYPELSIITHLEPLGTSSKDFLGTAGDEAEIQEAVRIVVQSQPDLSGEHKVLVRSYGDGRYVSFHCHVDPAMTVEKAHALATKVQAALLAKLPALSRVIVHTEPR